MNDDRKKFYEQFDHLLQYKILRVIMKNRTEKCLEIRAEIAELKDDYKESYEHLGKVLKFGLHEDSTVRAKIAELLRLNASESEDEQLNLKEYVDLMKVQMRNDLIKDFVDPLNKRIDDLMAQLESCQHVIVDEARRGQDRGETLWTEVHHC